ncbi:MAG: C2H2-type zinc finger protein [Ignavibacteriales bacterium]
MTQTNIEKFYEEIKQYPPTLRKLAIHIVNSSDDPSEYKTITQYSRECGLKPDVVRTLIAVSRKKGRDFSKLLCKAYYAKLASYRPKVMKSLVREALKGSYRHQQLYFELIGDIQKTTKGIEQNTNAQSLTFVVAMPTSIPESELLQRVKSTLPASRPEYSGVQDRGIIDAELVQDPDEEETIALKVEAHPCPLCSNSFKTLDDLRGHLSQAHEVE